MSDVSSDAFNEASSDISSDDFNGAPSDAPSNGSSDGSSDESSDASGDASGDASEAFSEEYDKEVVMEEMKVSLPVSNDIDLGKRNQFSVRSCYVKYYSIITELLGDSSRLGKPMKYITVTGSPGIGLSVFYVYFFQRYRRENPTKTIVTACFDKNNQLECCMVFKPGTIEGVVHKEIPTISGSIHLYDGPPGMKPHTNQMVCFTSVNANWFDNISSALNHKTLYLPRWSYTEMEKFMAKQKSPIKQWDDRYGMVGGSARLCMSKSKAVYEDHLAKMRLKYITIDSADKFGNFLLNPPMDEVSKNLIDWIPKKDSDRLPTLFETNYCSKQIFSIILDQSMEKQTFGFKRQRLF